MEDLVKEFSVLINNEGIILDDLSDKQAVLRKAIIEKDWTLLVDMINEVNQLSESFQASDIRRDEIQNQLTSEEIKPFLDKLSTLRTKLLKCKVENQVISNYVNVTKQFISEVVEKALPQTRNKNYTKYGTITQPQTASVLVDVRG